MRKIVLSEIVRGIYLSRMDEICAQIEASEPELHYDRHMFERDMLKSGLVVDPGTIRMKWKILEANEIIRSRRKAGQVQYYIPTSAFFAFVPSDYKRSLRTMEERQRDRETERGMSEGSL